jgi:cell division protein FtsQ
VRAATVSLGTVRVPRVRLERTARRRLAATALLAAVLSVVYMAWFRDSSFVRVEHVKITGLSTPEAARLRAKLTAAARRMTTLDVDTDALRAAVARDPVVRSISADGHFPNSLQIDVVLNVPAAVLAAPGQSLTVAGNGTLLPGARGGALPTVHVRALPRGTTLRDRRTLALIAIAADAPAPLRKLIDTIGAGPGDGLVAHMRGGLTVVFGDANRLEAKWAAAAAVLAQGSSAGASYVDVRRPEQPVAGGVTLPDPPLVDAQANPTEPGGPGVIDATAGNAAAQGQPAAPTAATTPSAPTNTRP